MQTEVLQKFECCDLFSSDDEEDKEHKKELAMEDKQDFLINLIISLDVNHM